MQWERYAFRRDQLQNDCFRILCSYFSTSLRYNLHVIEKESRAREGTYHWCSYDDLQSTKNRGKPASKYYQRRYGNRAPPPRNPVSPSRRLARRAEDSQPLPSKERQHTLLCHTTYNSLCSSLFAKIQTLYTEYNINEKQVSHDITTSICMPPPHCSIDAVTY